MQKTFSNRLGFEKIEEEISIREDAPHELRGVVIDQAYACKILPKLLRKIMCRILLKRPNDDNWSEFPNIDYEVRELIDECEWFEVYDIIETIYTSLKSKPHLNTCNIFENQLNKYFIKNGIGWKIHEGLVEMRGSATFERSVDSTLNAFSSNNHPNAKNELKEAIDDLSRRPNPDITGAIQHAMAALECVAREICGDKKATLGEILKKQQGLIPHPLDVAVSKSWGYASENARHISEGRKPSFEEAELIVGICSSISSYLISKSKA